MRRSSVLLLLAIFHALQSEGKKPLCANRAKRRIREDLIENVIFPDLIKNELQNSFYKQGQSSFYESILKNIANLVELKKNEIKDTIYPNQEDAMFQTSGDCKESYDKSIENDPSMTKYYTFSKMTAEEQKTLPWIDLLSTPFLHSLAKHKPAMNYQRKNTVFPNSGKLLLKDMNNPVNVKRKEIDEDGLNSIVKFFSSLGYGCSKKPNGHENEIELTNQHSVNNEILDDKIASSCLVENKSNFFKTDASSPYNKFIGVNRPDLFEPANFTTYLDRFQKENSSRNEKYSYCNEEKSKHQSNQLADQLRNLFGFGEYKSFRWPNSKINSIETLQSNTNFTNDSATGDRKTLEKDLDETNTNNAKNFIDVLGDINLDPPQNKYSQDFSGRFNATKYLSELLAQEADSHLSVSNDNLKTVLELNQTDMKQNSNDKNIIQSSNPFESVRVFNNLFNANKINEPDSKSVYADNSQRISPITTNTLEPKYNDHKCDIKALSKILNYKINTFDYSFNNVTTMEPQETSNWNLSNVNPIDNDMNTASEANKMPQPSIAIGENERSLPLDIRPGHERITLPEYEKMDNSGRGSTKMPDRTCSTILCYDIPATTSIELVQSTESSPSLGTDTLNALHRNMIPVIDFLGQMWNSPNRRNHISGVTSISRSLASDCGGYVIVPFPKNAMFQAWKRLEKTPLTKDTTDLEPSNTVITNTSNVSTLVNPSNRDLLEKFILRRLYDSFRGYLAPRRRAKRSRTSAHVIEDIHTDVASTTPASTLNSTQLPPTDKWIISSSPESIQCSNNSLRNV